jgi:predicted nucleic acid-binding protein
MIHLDTNYLIGLVAKPSVFKAQLVNWLSTSEILAVSAIAWSEFLNGPVTAQEIRDARLILEDRIIYFGVVEAETAARIYNQAGRRRGTRIDCFIAATAICARAPLATQNQRHFAPFTSAGLRLA